MLSLNFRGADSLHGCSYRQKTRFSTEVSASVCAVSRSGVECLVSYAAASGELPPNFKIATADAFVPDLVAAADAVMGKVSSPTQRGCMHCTKTFCIICIYHHLILAKRFKNGQPAPMQKYNRPCSILRLCVRCGAYSLHTMAQHGTERVATVYRACSAINLNSVASSAGRIWLSV